jgi:hypothetical protein
MVVAVVLAQLERDSGDEAEDLALAQKPPPGRKVERVAEARQVRDSRRPRTQEQRPILQVLMFQRPTPQASWVATLAVARRARRLEHGHGSRARPRARIKRSRYTSAMNEVLQDYEPDSPKWRIRGAADLTILSEAEPPNVLQQAAGLGPDKSWAKGDRLRAGGERRYNGLIYESGLDEKQSPIDHLAAMIERLRPYAEGIADVSGWPTTQSVRVRVVEHTIADNREVWAEPDDLAAIAAMKAQLVVDLYFYGADDE